MIKMKNMIILAIAITMLLSITACDGDNSGTENIEVKQMNDSDENYKIISYNELKGLNEEDDYTIKVEGIFEENGGGSSFNAGFIILESGNKISFYYYDTPKIVDGSSVTVVGDYEGIMGNYPHIQVSGESIEDGAEYTVSARLFEVDKNGDSVQLDDTELTNEIMDLVYTNIEVQNMRKSDNLHNVYSDDFIENKMNDDYDFYRKLKIVDTTGYPLISFFKEDNNYEVRVCVEEEGDDTFFWDVVIIKRDSSGKLKIVDVMYDA